MTTINNIKSSIKILFFVILLIGATANTYSQTQNQNVPQNEVDDMEADELLPPDDIDPLNAPFDGGASILLASGLAYGAKKYRERKKSKEDQKKSES